MRSVGSITDKNSSEVTLYFGVAVRVSVVQATVPASLSRTGGRWSEIGATSLILGRKVVTDSEGAFSNGHLTIH
jgi:hypothetical protein